MPTTGLFAGHEWRVSPAPLSLGTQLAKELESLGRVLLQFYRAVNLLYRKSVEGKQPEWVARWLDQGKPADKADKGAKGGDDGVRVTAPGTKVNVDKDSGKVSVTAPFTDVHVDPDKGRVRVRAPYVNLDISW